VISGGLGLALLAPCAQAQGRSPLHVPDQYIVVLKDQFPAAGAAAEIARQHGLKLGHVYEAALNGLSAMIPPARLAAVRSDPRVAYVEQDQVAFAVGQATPTGINRIDAELSSTVSGDGNGSVDIDVAVIDTGIQPNHPDLTVAGGINYTSGNSSQWADGNGHGTHVAGTIGALDNGDGVVGVAPGARLWAVRVLNNNGSGTWSNVIKGIDWVTKNAGKIRVANMSLGGGKSDAVNAAVTKAVKAGVVFAVAAGNEAADAKNSSPASCPDAITVAALADSNGLAGPAGDATPYGADETFATFSNYGDVVDIIAPGVNILSTWKGSGYATISGTSMATPHVAGAAALYIATSGVTDPTDVGNALVGVARAAGTIDDRHGRFVPMLSVKPF
jgi:subtilisin